MDFNVLFLVLKVGRQFAIGGLVSWKTIGQ
jgi:hypothetical protein